MLLRELRESRGLSQRELAGLLDVQQPAVSKLENRVDINLATLRRWVEAMGGTLEICARFDDRVVEIKRPRAGVRRAG